MAVHLWMNRQSNRQGKCYCSERDALYTSRTPLVLMPHFSIVSYLQSTNIGFKTELSSAEPETYTEKDTGASGFGQQIGVDGSVPDIKWIVVFNRSCSLKA